MRAVDRWVRAAFLSVFVALSFSRFDGESQPAHQSPVGMLRDGYPAESMQDGPRAVGLFFLEIHYE